MLLDKRISLMVPSTVQDAAGQPLESWSLHLEVWANVRWPSGLATVRADADVREVRASARIRYRDGLPDGMRAIIDGAPYRISAMLPAGRRQWIDLICERAS